MRLRGAGPKRGGKGGKSGKVAASKASMNMGVLKEALPKAEKVKPEEDSIPVVTGILESHPGSKDIKIGAFSLEIYGKVLVEDTTIELNYGRRYGLLGSNGCGKSTFLRCMAERLMPIPNHMDIFLLKQEVTKPPPPPPTSHTPPTAIAHLKHSHAPGRAGRQDGDAGCD